jgi:nitrogen regulatory protein P-II 2
MKYVTAVIQPFKLEEVREALEKIGVQSITASDAKGHGRQSGHTETYRGAEYNVSFVSKVKIELAIEASMLERVIEAIRTAGLSGQIGDGKIFIQNIERARRIRTGETGQAAL